MPAVSRFLFPGLLLSLVLAAIATLWNSSGPDGVEVAKPGWPMEAASAPPDEVEIIRRRDAAKFRVAAQVMAGELDLFEAAAHFRQINHEPPELMQLVYQRLPGATDEEKLCREVILWVKLRNPRQATHGEVLKAVAGLEYALASRGGVESATVGKRDDGQPKSGTFRAEEGKPMGEPVVPALAMPG
jgi:hypothetical protein